MNKPFHSQTKTSVWHHCTEHISNVYSCTVYTFLPESLTVAYSDSRDDERVQRSAVAHLVLLLETAGCSIPCYWFPAEEHSQASKLLYSHKYRDFNPGTFTSEKPVKGALFSALLVNLG